MKAHALVPALALAAALALPSLAEAGHRHGPSCGHHRSSYSRSYGRSHRHGHYARPYAYSYRNRPYGYGYAPPYGYGYYGYGYSAPYGHGAPYGYYAPPRRPRIGIGLYFGF